MTRTSDHGQSPVFDTAQRSPDRRAPSSQLRIASRMLAVARDRYGPVSRVETRWVATPEPATGEVLLEVWAAGVDRGVWHVATGLPYLMRLTGFGLRRPQQPLLGMDVAGRVAALGPDVTGLKVGDSVCGIGIGTFAEYAVARSDLLVAKPSQLSFAQAAAAPTSGVTAWQAVREIGKVQSGRRVLVLGASGGVGSFSVQLARSAGAEVTGVASAAKLDLVRSLGAHHVVDYATADALDGTVRYDVIIDTGGRNGLARLRRALTRDGTLVIVGGEGGGRWTGGVGRQLRAVTLSAVRRQTLTTFISSVTPRRLDQLRLALEEGLVPAVEHTYGFGEARRALQDLEAGLVRGKSAIEVRPGPVGEEDLLRSEDRR